MTPIKIPEEPYTIEGIMEGIGRQLNDADNQSDADAQPSPLIREDDPLREEAALIGVADGAKRIRPHYEIRSHRPVIGAILNLIKRFLHWGTRPYVDLAIEKQERFNESIIEVHRAGVRSRGKERKAREADFEEHRHRLEAFLKEQEEMNKALSEMIGVLRGRHDLGTFFDAIPKEKRLEFMARLRGAEADIAGRQAAYVDYFRNRPGQILDAGCGRGEFLGLLLNEGIEAWGCDADPLMVGLALKKDVFAREMDALTALRSVESASLGGVFAAQVVEHFFPGELLAFLKLAWEKTAPGGVIVLETLNSESLGAMARWYSKDLDHKQPIDPDYLASLLELTGFETVEVQRINPFPPGERLSDLPSAGELGISTTGRETFQRIVDRLNSTLWCEQDYYVAGEKPGASVGADGVAPDRS